MSRFLPATRTRCDAYSAAINVAAAPIRGVTYGGPDRSSGSPGPGWTTSNLVFPLEVASDLAVVEVPDDLVSYLGITGVPTLAQSKPEPALHPSLRTLTRARRGLSGPGAGTLRIMPVGDSITVGYTDNNFWTHPYLYGWRLPLFNTIETSHPGRITYVGECPEPRDGGGLSPDVNPASSFALADIGQDHHRGYGGQVASFLLAGIPAWMAQGAPDVVLLMCGINDIAPGRADDPTDNEANLLTLVNAIYTASPSVHLVIAQPFEQVQPTPAMLFYNTYIRDTLVPGQAALGRSIATVDQRAAFLNGASSATAAMYSNAINHPWNDGYARMAAAWLPAITPLL